MKKQDYHNSFVASVTPEEAFDSISDVKRWWAKNFEGSSRQLNDVFTVRFGETFVNFKIVEFVPNKLITWNVTDCYLHWIHDKTEWNGTSIRFDITREGEKTRISMTHVGLVPGVECYHDCELGWNEHFGSSLYKLLTEHVGLPM